MANNIFNVVVNRIHVNYAGLLWWDFLHCVQQKKDVIQYPRFTKLIIVDLMKKFPFIPQRLEEDYHSIKDDIPLVSMYTTRNVTVKGMLIPDEFLTDDICATQEYKEYEKEFVREELMEEDIEKMVDDKDEESYASEFTNFIFLNEEDDFGTRLELGSHKENPDTVDDDDDDDDDGKEEKKDDKKDDDNGDDYIDHTLVKDQVHEKVDKVHHEIIPQIASQATDDLIENNLRRAVADTIIQERDAFQAEVPVLISKEFVDHEPKIIEELFKIHMNNNVIQVHPTTSASTSTTTSVDLQQQLYLKMKDDSFCTQHHDDHQEDDAPPEGEKRAKRQKTSESLKSARGSSSKQPTSGYVSEHQQQQQD
ncbi:hypothetical protein Tco_0013551 [Tanacetum coccineum]